MKRYKITALHPHSKKGAVQLITAFVVSCLFLCTLTGCKKLIEIEPAGASLLTSNVFKDSATVQSALAGMYIAPVYRTVTSTYPGFSADELSYVGTNFDPFINNSLLSTESNLNTIWSNFYSNIFNANSVIAGIANAQNLSVEFQSQAVAEARFIRAYTYFYLVNLFGDVPLILSTDVNENIKMARIPVADAYAQMIADLKFAQSTLPADYSISANARTRANKWIATTMLAKVQLYLGNWAEAEAEATKVINTTGLYTLYTTPADLVKVFTPTSTEAIWQLYNDASGFTQYASTVLPNATTKIPTYVLTSSLAGAFEAEDARKTVWTSSVLYNTITYVIPAKYKSVTFGANAEYFTPLRLAEVYLIRAEARAQQNNITGAQGDISIIRNRANLGNTIAADKTSLLLAVEQERRIELYGENGNRWFDLKRTGRVNTVIGALKPMLWKPTAALFPIPQQQITANPNLKPNPGYN